MPSSRALLRYGILGLPLAFCGLPIYVHIPHYYASHFHVNLETLGILLLVLRCLDAVFDPLIGRISDRYPFHVKTMMMVSVAVLAVSYAAVFNPPVWAQEHASPWLALCLTLVYVSFSTLMINYYARGVRIGSLSRDHTRVAAYREGSILIGVLLAALLPTLLERWFDVQTSYRLFGLLLGPLLIVCAYTALSDTVPSPPRPDTTPFSMMKLLKQRDVAWILSIGFCNAIPAAITSTLFLFFTQDVLGAASMSGPLLALYFLSAACGMPLWSLLSRRWGRKRTLQVAMISAVACFIWAATLSAGEVKAFAIICVLSGMTLGADTMLFPALLAEALARAPGVFASGFGLWNFINKLTMALAAGFALPLLAFAHYAPGTSNTPSALHALSLCYAIAPCLLKVGAVFLLSVSPLEQRTGRDASP